MLIDTGKAAAKIAKECSSMLEEKINKFALHFILGHGSGHSGYRVGKARVLTRASLKCIAQWQLHASFSSSVGEPESKGKQSVDL